MKSLQWLVIIGLLVLGFGGALHFRKVAQEAERISDWREKTQQALAEQAKADADKRLKQRDRELQTLRTDAEEVHKLRNEVTQLRGGSREVDQLRGENQALRAQLREALAARPIASDAPAPADQFPRAKWAFSGYATPESALVSAISAMRDGNPKSYLDSLAPDEQKRLAAQWLNKSEGEIAAKHQGDVSTITGMRVLDRQNVSADEVLMNVYLEGIGRMEKVSMKRVGNDWKFGGYVRPPAK